MYIDHNSIIKNYVLATANWVTLVEMKPQDYDVGWRLPRQRLPPGQQRPPRPNFVAVDVVVPTGNIWLNTDAVAKMQGYQAVPLSGNWEARPTSRIHCPRCQPPFCYLNRKLRVKRHQIGA